VLPRVVKNFSGAHLHDDKEKIRNKILLLRPKTKTSFFSHLLILLLLIAATKNVAKMLLNIKGNFFIEKIFFKKSF